MTIFLTPIGLDRECWGALGSSSADDVLIEYPGHGDGPDALSGPFGGLDDTIDRIAEQIPEPATVIGQSLGGMMALQLATRYPEKVSSAVVSGCGANSGPGRAMLLGRASKARERGMSGILEETLERWFGSLLAKDASHPGITYARERLLALDPESFAAGWEACAEHDVSKQISLITVPVSVIAGRSDLSVPVEGMLALYDHLADARFEVIQAGHMPSLENPRQYWRAVNNHLAWVAENEITAGVQ